MEPTLEQPAADDGAEELSPEVDAPRVEPTPTEPRVRAYLSGGPRGHDVATGGGRWTVAYGAALYDERHGGDRR